MIANLPGGISAACVANSSPVLPHRYCCAASSGCLARYQCHKHLGAVADAFSINLNDNLRLLRHAVKRPRSPKRHEQQHKLDTVLVTELSSMSEGMAQTTQAVKLDGNSMFYLPPACREPGDGGSTWRDSSAAVSLEAGAGAGAGAAELPHLPAG